MWTFIYFISNTTITTETLQDNYCVIVKIMIKPYYEMQVILTD